MNLNATPIGRYMVCLPCLKAHFGGSEKCCSHGWDFVAGKPRGGVCSKCGETVNELHLRWRSEAPFWTTSPPSGQSRTRP